MIIADHLDLPTHSRLPTGGRDGTSSPEAGYIWHFSTQGLPAIRLPAESRGLLPHIFTLIPMMHRDSYFLWHCLAPVLPGCPDVIGIRCSVLSGLSFPVFTGTIVQPAVDAKINIKSWCFS